MPYRPLALCCLFAACATAQVRWTGHLIQNLAGERVAGCALRGPNLVTWGDRLVARTLPGGAPRVLRGAGASLAEGGCLTDVDGDGQADIVVNENGADHALVWFQAPRWSRHLIDTGIDAPDILPATLFSRHGILLIQKRIQIRFYEVPGNSAARWPSQDVYSVYTPSWQGGLHLADLDGDGRMDILCGNYWVRSPESFELPWHLFAINTWTELDRSGMMRLAYTGLFSRSPVLVAAQRDMDGARLAWFAKPSDPRLIWEEHRLAADLDLAHPGSLDVADFDGDGRPDLLLAERAGAGRLLLLRQTAAGGFEPNVIQQGSPVQHAQAADLNGDRRPDILVIDRNAISWWENQR